MLLNSACLFLFGLSFARFTAFAESSSLRLIPRRREAHKPLFHYCISNLLHFLSLLPSPTDETWVDLARHQECRRHERAALSHNRGRRAAQRRWINANRSDSKSKRDESLSKIVFDVTAMEIFQESWTRRTMSGDHLTLPWDIIIISHRKIHEGMHLPFIIYEENRRWKSNTETEKPEIDRSIFFVA